jgi:hypothetical protein
MSRMPYVVFTGLMTMCTIFLFDYFVLLHGAAVESAVSALIVGAAAALGGAFYLRRQGLPISATYGDYKTARHSGADRPV